MGQSSCKCLGNDEDEFKSLDLLPTIVWYDPNIESHPEKNANIKTLESLGYLVKTFNDVSKVTEFLGMTNLQNIMIGSGSNQTELVPAVHEYKNVHRIILYETTPEDQTALDEEYNTIVIFLKEWSELVPQVQKESKDYQTWAAIEAGKDLGFDQAGNVLAHRVKVDGNVVEYYHFAQEKTMDFKLASFISHGQVCDEKEVLEELIALNTWQGDYIKELFNQRLPNMLHSICYVYSSDAIYNQFNQCCASKAYSAVMKTITASVRELKGQSHRIYRPKDNNDCLYRGVRSGRINIEEYSGNVRGYWPGFSSTSYDIQVAKNFAGYGGNIFVIHLDQNDPHPNVILEDGWSAYPGEKEVLFLPYFALKVDRVEVNEDDGYTYIHISQNMEDSALTLKDDDQWRSKIVNSIMAEIEEECTTMYNKTCSALDIMKYIQGPQFKAIFDDFFEEEYKKEIADGVLDINQLTEAIEDRMKVKMPETMRIHLTKTIDEANSKDMEVFQKIGQLIEFKFDFKTERLADVLEDVFNLIKKTKPQNLENSVLTAEDIKQMTKLTIWQDTMNNLLEERKSVDKYSETLINNYTKIFDGMKKILLQRMKDILGEEKKVQA